MSIITSIIIGTIILAIGHEIARRHEAREAAEHNEQLARLRERLGR